MKTLLAFFGLIFLFILTFLSGGFALLVVLVYTTSGRAAVVAGIKELLYPSKDQDD